MRKSRAGISMMLVLVSLVVLLAAGGTTYVYYFRGGEAEVFDPITTNVTEGEFVAQVLSEGEIQSSANQEIKCEVSARNGSVTVLRVVPEGTRVKGGDELIELDSTAFDKELEQQRIAVTSAETQKIRSKADLDTALISLDEYKKGTLVESLTKFELDKKAAEQELALAQEKFVYSQQMQAKNFITRQQLKGDELAVAQAKRRVQLVDKQIDVLKQYTAKKELKRLESDIAAAQVKLRNDEEAYQVELDKLHEIEDLIEKCTISVPEGVSGQVTYNKEFSRRGNTEWILEPGAEVREGQVLIRLPDQDKMEVKALVQESSITSVRVGMPAEIRVDALNNRILKGVVTKVNQYPEQSGWGSSSIRKYAVLVRIINPPSELIPGMNSSVAIQTRQETGKLQIPVQAVYGVQGQYFCLVKRGNRFETVEVELDGDNSTMTVVASGLKEGEEVVLNPGAYKEYMDLPEIVLDQAIEMSDEEAREADEQVEDAKRNPSSNDGDGRIDAIFKPADTNSDGKLSTAELEGVDERMRGRLKRADANNDGEITKQEVSAMFTRMMERMQGGQGGQGGGFGGQGGRGPGGGGRGPNADGDGASPNQEAAAATTDGETQPADSPKE